MRNHEAETLLEHADRLSLPSLLNAIGQLTGVANDRARQLPQSLPEVAECLELVDKLSKPHGLRDLKCSLTAALCARAIASGSFDALRGLMIGHEELRSLLLDIGFMPFDERSMDDVCVDLTLGVPDGRALGDELRFDRGGRLVVPSIERHDAIPAGVVGVVLMKSQPARRGWDHATSVLIKPGSSGHVWMELTYDGARTDSVIAGQTALAQLGFIRVAGRNNDDVNHRSNTTPTLSEVTPTR